MRIISYLFVALGVARTGLLQGAGEGYDPGVNEGCRSAVRSPRHLHFPLLFCLLPGQVGLALNPNP
jgi:hypothetical protein